MAVGIKHEQRSESHGGTMNDKKDLNLEINKTPIISRILEWYDPPQKDNIYRQGKQSRDPIFFGPLQAPY